MNYDELLKKQAKERLEFGNKEVTSLLNNRKFVEKALVDAIVNKYSGSNLLTDIDVSQCVKNFCFESCESNVSLPQDMILLPLSSPNKQFHKKEFYGVRVNGTVAVSSDVKRPFKCIVRDLFDYLIDNKSLDLVGVLSGSDLLYNRDYIFCNSDTELELRRAEQKKACNNNKRRLDVIYRNADGSIIIASPYEINNEKEAKLIKDILVMTLPSLDSVEFICKSV